VIEQGKYNGGRKRCQLGTPPIGLVAYGKGEAMERIAEEEITKLTSAALSV
jgi:hypothetical protein